MTAVRGTLPTHLGGYYGDIVHVRSSGFYPWAIRRCLPDAWGNHDGILCHNGDEWGVAEAVMPRFKFTPWVEYQDEIEDGKTSVVFMRHPDMSAEDGIKASEIALEMVQEAPEYDWTAILRIGLNTIFKRNSQKWNKKWEWYCTESCMHIYKQVKTSYNIWNKGLPTPYTTEKREQAGLLKVEGWSYCKEEEEYHDNFI